MVTESELKRYRRRLEQRRAEIRGVRERTDAQWQEMHDREVEFEENAQEEHLGRPMVSLDERTRDELEAVSAAIGRIDAGTFGVCQICGMDIGPERLEVIPWTPYCISCAREEAGEERHATMEEHPPAMMADRELDPLRRPKPGPKTDEQVMMEGEDTSQDPWGVEREEGTAMEPADRLIPESKR